MNRRREIVRMAYVAVVLGGPILMGGNAAATAMAVVLFAVLAPLLRGWYPPWFGTATGAIGAIVVAGGAVVGHAPREALAIGLMLWLLARRLAPEGPDADRVLGLLGTLLLVAAAGAEPHPAMLPLWGAWTVLLPSLLTPSAGRRLGGPTALVAGVAMAIFVVLPRPPPDPDDVPAAAVTKLAREVEPGGFAGLVEDDTVVATVRFTGQRPVPLRLRAAALTSFDGLVWRRDAPLAAEDAFATAFVEEALTVEVEHTDLDGLVLAPVALVAGRVPGRQDVDGAWHVREAGEVRYPAMVGPREPLPPRELRAHRREAALALPPTIHPDVLELGRALAADRPHLWAAMDVVSFLRTEFTYDRGAAPEAVDPLHAFLFERRRGHCEAFASAAAVLLRAGGVPARVAIGFASPQVDDDRLVYTMDRAHAWTEVHVDGVGWVSIDATAAAPPGLQPARRADGSAALPLFDVGPLTPAPPPTFAQWFDRHVVAFDRAQQAEVLRRLRPLLVLVGGVLGVLALVLVLQRVRWPWARRARGADALALRPLDPTRAAWRSTVEALADVGWEAPPWLAEVGQARWFADRLPAAAAPLITRLGWIVAEVRYAGVPAGEHAAEAARLRDAVVAALSGPRGDADPTAGATPRRSPSPG